MTRNRRSLCLLLGLAMATAALPVMAQSRPAYDPFHGRPRAGTGRRKLKTKDTIASVEFVNTPISTVFKMISDLTGWSILLSQEVSKSPPRINIWVKDLTAQQLLEEICLLGELVIDRSGSTIRVMTFSEYSRLYGVQKRVIKLKHAAPGDVVKILQPFLEKRGHFQLIADDRSRKIILLVPKPMAESLEELVRAVDEPMDWEKDTLQIYRPKYLDAVSFIQVLERFLGGSVRSSTVRTGRTTPSAAAPTSRAAEPIEAAGQYVVRFMVEPRLNAIILRGIQEDVAKVLKLIIDLDLPKDTKIKGYALQYTDPREVHDTLTRLLSADRAAPGQQRLHIALSEQNSRIVVEGTDRDHERIARYVEAIDVPLPPGTGGMRVYRLENTTADEVVRILQDLIDSLDDVTIRGRRRRARVSPLLPSAGGVRRVRTEDRTPRTQSAGQERRRTSAGAAAPLSPEDASPPRVIAAPEINAVIIKATAAEHEEFALLVQELDRPRAQVILQVTLVTVRSSEGFDLGLELAGSRLNTAEAKAVGFTHFGIAGIDTATGLLSFPEQALFGANFALFNSDDFQLVLNALRSVGDTRISSAPRILVEDNTEAAISQTDQEPFEQTNQGDATTTVSFGGFVDAGTTLTVTPHISERDWLRLVYEITFSSFGARVNQALPPPRLENEIRGTVRIPADYTVVLGGLIDSREDKTENSVPFLSEIPLLGELFKSRRENKVNETLFVFIRPVILRSTTFEDLKYLSKDDIRKARVRHHTGPRNPMKLFAVLDDVAAKE